MWEPGLCRLPRVGGQTASCVRRGCWVLTMQQVPTMEG
uniref:Uncharacterized protein n=1 Tax=Anguilla anguilla TaxID=7936 RepID=A0A0E9ULG9_ANGAN